MSKIRIRKRRGWKGYYEVYENGIDVGMEVRDFSSGRRYNDWRLLKSTGGVFMEEVARNLPSPIDNRKELLERLDKELKQPTKPKERMKQ